MDSDYSNDDNEPPMKEGPGPQSFGTLDGPNTVISASAQSIFLQGNNQSGVMISQTVTQKRQLAVINEIDDRKDSKKKGSNGGTGGKKKSK